MRFTLSARPPFSLAAVMRSHGWVQLSPFAAEEGSGGLTYLAELDSGRVVDMLIQEAAGGVSVVVDDDLGEQAFAAAQGDTAGRRRGIEDQDQLTRHPTLP